MSSLDLTTHPLTQVEIASLKQGKLLLHCPEMRLVQSTVDLSRFYSGPGFISQDDERNLQFTLYAEEAVLLEDIMEDFVAGKYVAGEIIPPSSYFRLTATDLTGRTWIAERLSPRRNSSFPGKTVVTGSIHEISWEEPQKKESESVALTLIFFKSMRLPFNQKTVQTIEAGGKKSQGFSLNVLKFEFDSFRFFFQDDQHGLSLIATVPASNYSPNLKTRIRESLWFTTGELLYPAVVLEYTDKHRRAYLYSPDKDMELRTVVRPPLMLQLASSNEFIELFRRFFLYIISYEPSRLHPISVQIRSIIRASVGTLEARALSLSVGVEALVRSVVAQEELSQKEQEALINLRQYIKKEWQAPETLRHRAIGLTGLLKQQSAVQCLQTLVEDGAIKKEQKESWRKLRNTIAHGSSLSHSKMQKNFDSFQEVLVLFHHIIFHAIGYQGPFTDYSSRGYPKIEYKQHKK